MCLGVTFSAGGGLKGINGGKDGGMVGWRSGRAGEKEMERTEKHRYSGDKKAEMLKTRRERQPPSVREERGVRKQE